MAVNNNETDNIHEDIREIRGLLVKVVDNQGAQGAKLDTLLDRELPALWKRATDAQTAAAQAKAIAAKTNARLNKQVAYASGFASAISFVFALVGKWFATKITFFAHGS